MKQSEQMQSRQHPRRMCRKMRVAWSAYAGGPLHPASVVDMSASGIGIIVEQSRLPHMGGALRILSRQDQYVRHARVIRLVESPDGKTLVGCRWISQRGAGRTHRPGGVRGTFSPRVNQKGASA